MAYVASLEIHHVGITGGDSTVILVRWHDGADAGAPAKVTCVLIDAGGETYDGGLRRLQSYLAGTLAADLGGQFYIAVASHYHADHIAGFQACGVDFLGIMDAGGYAVGNDVWTPVNPLGNLAGDSSVLQAYGYHVTQRFEAGGRTRIEIPFAKAANYTNGVLNEGCDGPKVVDLVPGGEVQLTCWCAAGVLPNGVNALRESVKKRILRRNGRADNGSDLTQEEQAQLEGLADLELEKVSPNDLSLAFILSWGGFRYFTAGDLSGDLSLTRYANVEEPLVAYLLAQYPAVIPITVMKATHHGSNHNNYPASVDRTVDYTLASGSEDDEGATGTGVQQTFMAGNRGLLQELLPETIVVSCNQMKGVPGSEYIARVRDHCTAQAGRTVNFVNDCRYAHPQYASKQKAQKSDLDGLADVVADTGLYQVFGRTTNARAPADSPFAVTPRAIVVNVPALDRSQVTGQNVALIDKVAYSVKIDYTQVAARGERLALLNTGQALANLSVEMYNDLDADLSTRAAEIEYLAANGSMDYVRRRFPSLVDTSGAQPVLRDADAAGIQARLRSLLQGCYPGVDENGVYVPDGTRTSPYQRTTVYSVQRNTPDPDVYGHSVIGTSPFDAEVAAYWDAHGLYQQVPGQKRSSTRLRPSSKRPRTGSGSS